MAFDFGDFIGQVADNLGVGDTESIADIASANISAGIDRVKDKASQVAPQNPTVQPTAYAARQLANAPTEFSLSPLQTKALVWGSIVIIGFVAWKVLRK